METDNEFVIAKQFLAKNVLCTLATIEPVRKTPQASFVYYWYDGRTHVYIATLTSSRKVANISEENIVAVAIGNEDLGQTIQIEGNASLVSDREEEVAILENLHKHIQEHPPKMIVWPMLQLHPQDISIVKVSIQWFRFSSFSDPMFTKEGSGNDLLTAQRLD